MAKVLFLDIDGVLNSSVGWERDKPNSWQYVTPECVTTLKWVLDTCPDVKIVVSSTWRRHFKIEAFRAMFDAIGLDGDKIVGYTPMRMSDRLRGHEIQEYLDDHTDVTGFVIVDDTDDMVHLSDRFVHTDMTDGLTEINAVEIVRRFGEMS